MELLHALDQLHLQKLMGDTYDKVLTKFSLIYYRSKYKIVWNITAKIVYDN